MVKWPPGKLSWRWAKSNAFAIHAIHEESQLVKPMPSWEQTSLTLEELKALPTKWKVALREWRGIYFILDKTDGKGYVGSAYGKENLLGRWQNYSATGHGGDEKLKERNPAQFVFSILQRTSPDELENDVLRLEESWKERLHTREFGLN